MSSVEAAAPPLKMLTMKEAVKLSGLHSKTLTRYAESGQIEGVARVPWRGSQTAWTFPEESIRYFMAHRTPQSLAMQKKRSEKHWSTSSKKTPELKSVDKLHQEKSDALLTVPELAELASVSTSWLYKLATEGRLPGAVRTSPDGRWLISRNDAEKWMAGETEGTAPGAKGRRGPKPGVKMPREEQHDLPSVEDALQKVEVSIRELRYALGREKRESARKLQTRFQEMLQEMSKP